MDSLITISANGEKQQERRRKRKRPFDINHQRRRDIARLVVHRHGKLAKAALCIPYAVAAAWHCPSDSERRFLMVKWCRWCCAPPSVEREIDAILEANPARRIRADTLARHLYVSDAERTAVRIWTIGAYDMPRAERLKRRKENRRLAAKARRQDHDAKPREESYSRTKPWEAFGIKRRAWEYRGKPMPPEPVAQIRGQDASLPCGYEFAQSPSPVCGNDDRRRLYGGRAGRTNLCQQSPRPRGELDHLDAKARAREHHDQRGGHTSLEGGPNLQHHGGGLAQRADALRPRAGISAEPMEGATPKPLHTPHSLHLLLPLSHRPHTKPTSATRTQKNLAMEAEKQIKARGRVEKGASQPMPSPRFVARQRIALELTRVRWSTPHKPTREMLALVRNYAGQITRCPPGRARGYRLSRAAEIKRRRCREER
jgi:hypothetical protein